MTVIEYIVEEVTRQGHDASRLDGIERVGWMTDAWAYALRAIYDRPTVRPTMEDALNLGMIIEPVQNNGIRRHNVRVGPHMPPNFQEVPQLLERLFTHGDQLTPVEFYKEFEMIHPFLDGNGRTGKVLLNWLNGTLLKPVFPPADLFGEPIGNP